MVLRITLSRETRVSDKSPVMFVLANVYRPPGHHTDFIKEFADFLSELVLAADKVLIVGDFNIHVDNEKDALGSAFIDILNSIGVRQHVSGPTHCRNHTLDLILSHGIDVSGVEILQQSNDISDHYLVLCKLYIAKTVNSTPCYKYGRTITSSTKDCFVSNLSWSVPLSDSFLLFTRILSLSATRGGCFLPVIGCCTWGSNQR